MATGVRRRLGSAGGMLLLGLLAAVGVAVSPFGTSVTVPGGGGTDPLMGMTMLPARDGHAYLRATPLCLRGLIPLTYPVSITNAQLYGVTGDLRLDEYAVTTRSNGAAAGGGTLRSAGLDPSRTKVGTRCTDDVLRDELSLQYSLTGPRTGRAEGVRLFYGIGRHLDLGIAVTLCGPQDPNPTSDVGAACPGGSSG